MGRGSLGARARSCWRKCREWWDLEEQGFSGPPVSVAQPCTNHRWRLLLGLTLLFRCATRLDANRVRPILIHQMIANGVTTL